MNSVTRLLTTKLKLRVNSEKSAVARPWVRKFLGFSFTNHKQPKRRVAPKAVVRFKERVRELTRRTRGISLARMVHDLAEYFRGWIGYFGRCQTPSVLEELAPTSTPVDGLATVETRDHTISRTPQARPRCAGGRANCGQFRWTVAPRENPSTEHRSVQRSLRLARASRAHDSWLVRPAELPDADPHVRSCGRGEWVTTPPMPIS
jgi:Group II intron, maturase-specific domain